MLPALPKEAKEIIDVISAAGGRGYVVGGAVRDLLLGLTPTDWDFAATLEPQELLRIFPASTLIGGSCGTVQVPFGKGKCEITPCRSESKYTDHRHPDEIVFVPDIFADLARRDFTVNAMAWDGEILLDPFGGQMDIERHELRCVGNPLERFAEDPLRILRLFRFAATLGFLAEWDTFNAAAATMHLLDTLPPERVLAEVKAILMSDAPGLLSAIIAKGGLRKYGFDFAPSLDILAQVPRLPLCRWWAFIALCGADTATVQEGFNFSHRMRESLAECTKLYRLGPASSRTRLKQKLSGTKLSYGKIAHTFALISPAFEAEPALFDELCASGEPYRLQDLAVNGDMLRYEGISGKKCGLVLNELLNTVIKNPSLNKAPVLLGLAKGLKQLL